MSPARLAPYTIVVIDRDERSGMLLVQYLEAHGLHAELESDPRRVLRRRLRSPNHAQPVVLKMDDDDPDGFELLAALAAHALDAHVVVCSRRGLELRAVRVDRCLPSPCRFSAIVNALEDIQSGYVLPDAAE